VHRRARARCEHAEEKITVGFFGTSFFWPMIVVSVRAIGVLTFV